MNREDIIHMAREAGFEELGSRSDDWVCFGDELERFATLVAAAEREACAKVCEELETCSDAEFYGHEFATAIRARSNT